MVTVIYVQVCLLISVSISAIINLTGATVNLSVIIQNFYFRHILSRVGGMLSFCITTECSNKNFICENSVKARVKD